MLCSVSLRYYHSLVWLGHYCFGFYDEMVISYAQTMNIFYSVMLWSLWKFQNKLCFQEKRWSNIKEVCCL